MYCISFPCNRVPSHVGKVSIKGLFFSFESFGNTIYIYMCQTDIKTTDSVDQLVLFVCCFNHYTSRQPRQNDRSRKMLHEVIMK